MTPEQFLARLAKNGPEPAYLVPRPGSVRADALPPRAARRRFAARKERENGFTRHDLDRTPLAAALDDARALSLFASRRVIWLAGGRSRSPSCAPRPRRQEDADAEDETGGASLAAYLKEPTPDVTLVIDCSRYEFEGEDKPRMERVEAFFAAVPAKVEFRPVCAGGRAFPGPEASQRSRASNWVSAELALLLEATGGDASRIAMEIEKLRLFAGTARKITADDIAALVPDAQSSTIFVLVAALGRGDRARALEILDTLSRVGRVYAAGADVPRHAIPDGAGGSRSRPARRGPDSGALQ